MVTLTVGSTAKRKGGREFIRFSRSGELLLLPCRSTQWLTLPNGLALSYFHTHTEVHPHTHTGTQAQAHTNVDTHKHNHITNLWNEQQRIQAAHNAFQGYTGMRMFIPVFLAHFYAQFQWAKLAVSNETRRDETRRDETNESGALVAASLSLKAAWVHSIDFPCISYTHAYLSIYPYTDIQVNMYYMRVCVCLFVSVCVYAELIIDRQLNILCAFVVWPATFCNHCAGHFGCDSVVAVAVNRQIFDSSTLHVARCKVRYVVDWIMPASSVSPFNCAQNGNVLIKKYALRWAAHTRNTACRMPHCHVAVCGRRLVHQHSWEC